MDNTQGWTCGYCIKVEGIEIGCKAWDGKRKVGRNLVDVESCTPDTCGYSFKSFVTANDPNWPFIMVK